MPSLRDLPWALLVLLSRRRRVDGIEICVAAAAPEACQVFDRVAEALGVITQYDPSLIEELRHTASRLLFTEAPGGHYIAGISTCRIGIGFAKRSPALNLAMMIVHEATHARLARNGMCYVGEQREVIERLCVGAEISFAERVPDSEEAIAKARALLETRWWDASAHAESTVNELAERGVPRWIAKRLVARGLARARTR